MSPRYKCECMCDEDNELTVQHMRKSVMIILGKIGERFEKKSTKIALGQSVEHLQGTRARAGKSRARAQMRVEKAVRGAEQRRAAAQG